MLSQHLFNAVSHLVVSRWARDYEEHNGHCEDAFYAQFGPLHLEVNRCFVLDHDDARVFVQLPTPLRHAQGWLWGNLCVGYVVCLGEEQIRQPGFYTDWQPIIRNRNSVETATSPSSKKLSSSVQAVCRTEDIPF